MAIQDFLIKYWYVFAVAGVILLLYIYTKLDPYTKRQISKTLNKRNLIIIGLVAGWYFWNKYGNIAEVSDANRWMPLIVLACFTFTQIIGNLRYQTQQFICPNFHGSFSKPPKHVNGFYLFAIDSFNAGGVAWDYGSRIVVVREETAELFIEGAISIANLGFVSRYELDDDVRHFIETNKYFKGATNNVYYGWFDNIERVDFDFQKLKKLADQSKDSHNIYNLLKKELNVDNPSIPTLYWMYRNQCKATSKQTENYDATVESVEKGVEHVKRVREAYIDKPEQSYKSQEGYEEA
jgi:hypothetical protein